MRVLDPRSNLTVGLKGFWPLDDAGISLARDISGYGNHARYVTTQPTRAYNRIGPGIYWPSSGAQMQAPNFKIPANTPVTFSFWVGAQTTDPSGAFSMGSAELCGCWAPYGNVLYWDYPRSGTARLTTNYTSYTGKLTLVTVVSNASNFRAIYLNGRVVASDTGSVAASTNLSSLNIGRYVAGGGSSYRTLNNFRVWFRVLQPEEIAQLYATPWAGTLQTAPRAYLGPNAYSLSADGIARTYSLGAATLTRGYALSAEGVARRYSFGSAGLVWQPAQVGDTHDGFKRRSRRERALDAAAERARQEWITERNALRLSLEAAMGYAAEVVEGAPDEAVAAVEEAAQQARVVLPTLARKPSAVDLAAAVALVERLQAATEEAARLKALAEDDEEVLMLLRAL